MTDEYSHVHADSRAHFGLSEIDRIIACSNDFWLKHPEGERLIGRLNLMVKMKNKTVAPSVLVTGTGGAGKSSTVNEMKIRNSTAENKMIFVTMHQSPNGYSLKDLILTAMGLDVAKRIRQTTNITPEMKYLIKSQNICAIVIDEVHDALTLPPAQQAINLSLLKNLSGSDYGLSVIAFGVPTAARVLRKDPQLARRFGVQTLKRWDTSNETRSFIGSYIKRLPLKLPTDLKDDTLYIKIIEKGQGLTDSIVKILQCAAMAAIVDKSERITHYHLDNIHSIMEEFCIALRDISDSDDEDN